MARPITLTWNDVGANHYKVQVLTAASGGSVVANNPTATGGSWTIPAATALTTGATYYWQVKSCNAANTCSGWSGQGSFTVLP